MSDAPLPARVFLFGTRPGDAYRSGRSRRSLAAVGLTAQEVGNLDEQTFRELLRGGGPVLLLPAGAWLARPQEFKLPPSSATGKGLCAFGAVKLPAETEPETTHAAQLWKEWLASTGGDFSVERGIHAASPSAIAGATEYSQLSPLLNGRRPEGRAPQTRQASFNTHSPPSAAFPPPACVYLDARAVAILNARGVSSLSELLTGAENLRAIHYAPLDVHDDTGLRVLQVITALHRGGAERLTLDLVAELPAQNVRTGLATLGRPLRDAFAPPPRTIELARAGATAEARAAALSQAAVQFGADLVHGHLIRGEDVQRLAQAGLPTVVTVHNLRAGWPVGLAELPPAKGVLLAACAQAVEADLRAANLPLTLRTVWNGIDLRAFKLTSERQAAGEKWRQDWGFDQRDFVLAAVANPRPQKRLHRLPAILTALRARLGPDREARLVLSGEAMPGKPETEQCVTELRGEIARLGLDPHVRWTGPVADVAGLLAAADVLVSTSAHEGLSLAQLEALAMGRAVVATDVGGAREVAWDNPGLHLLSPDASPEKFAELLAKVAKTSFSSSSSSSCSSPSRRTDYEDEEDGGAGCVGLRTARPTSASPQALDRTRPSLQNWSRDKMAARYRWLYPRVIAAAKRAGRGQGLWLIANNFSTGGAQSSARRLLMALAAQHLPVRAAVIEENPANPTPGRRALLAAGIPVLSVPGTDIRDAGAAVETLLAAIDADPPQSVLFWNLRPSFKVLLADALLDIPVFDVSPGEMFFASLEQYFAQPRPGLPYRTARDYGARLAGVIVKYHAEARQAAEILGAPVHVVPNGVPLAEARPRIPAPQAPLVIGTAARLNPQKRLEDLLEALHLAHDRLPAYRLKIAGGVERGCDEYAARLRTLANGLPIDWLGETADVAAFHRELDLFAMISEPAGCPNASLEAMASGLPVIATAVGGAGEQVLDGHNGRLVPARSPQPLAEALVQLATQPALRQRMGTAAREFIRNRFPLEQMVAGYTRVCLGEKAV
jgi:glycosyltransferase involved in cell wall biosynthesis